MEILFDEKLIVMAMFVNIVTDIIKRWIPWRKHLYRIVTLGIAVGVVWLRSMWGSPTNTFFIESIAVGILALSLYDLSGYRVLSKMLRKRFGLEQERRRRKDDV